jgi:hypothetical protein
MSEGLADLADWDLRARQGGRTDDVQVREQARRRDWMVRQDQFVRLQLISGIVNDNAGVWGGTLW